MAVLRLELDNIFCFKKFEADFTYPKKLVKTSLDSEFLKDYPNMRYKKVNILIGANSSGKTSLGIAIWKTFLFIKDKEAKPFREMIADSNREASVLMDCAFEDGQFFRFEARMSTDEQIYVKYREIALRKDDTYESAVKRLPDGEFQPYNIALENAYVSGWNFRFPSIESGCDFISCKVDKTLYKEFVKTLNLILKSFDPSIVDVYKSNDAEDAYVIKFEDGRSEIVRHGYKLSELKQLSSGTKYAVNVANVLFSIKIHNNGFYYVDEQFSYVNSDLEIACLNSMIELLGDGEQLFFTTHNEGLMELPYPIHSFSFMKKEKEKDGYHAKLINASEFEKRNNISVKNLYDNDYFDVSPDVSKVFEVLN